MTEHQKQNYYSIGLFTALLAIDQFLKYKAILSFNYLLNSGLVFGFIKSNILAIIVSIILILAAFYAIFIRKVAIYPLTIVIAGLFSNLIDRFVYKGVVDYWEFFKLFWFNLSDLLIVVVAILGVTTYFWSKKTSR